MKKGFSRDVEFGKKIKDINNAIETVQISSGYIVIVTDSQVMGFKMTRG